MTEHKPSFILLAEREEESWSRFVNHCYACLQLPFGEITSVQFYGQTANCLVIALSSLNQLQRFVGRGNEILPIIHPHPNLSKIEIHQDLINRVDKVKEKIGISPAFLIVVLHNILKEQSLVEATLLSKMTILSHLIQPALPLEMRSQKELKTKLTQGAKEATSEFLDSMYSIALPLSHSLLFESAQLIDFFDNRILHVMILFILSKKLLVTLSMSKKEKVDLFELFGISQELKEIFNTLWNALSFDLKIEKEANLVQVPKQWKISNIKLSSIRTGKSKPKSIRFQNNFVNQLEGDWKKRLAPYEVEYKDNESTKLFLEQYHWHCQQKLDDKIFKPNPEHRHRDIEEQKQLHRYAETLASTFDHRVIIPSADVSKSKQKKQEKELKKMNKRKEVPPKVTITF